MKLKLMTKSSEKLKETLSLISHVRKFVVLKFTPSELSVILINGQAVKLEPQVWCKLPVSELFQGCEIQSVRDNTILMEINIDLLVQTLKNFDKANSEGLNIRLQRTDTSGAKGTSTTTGRTASLALFYSNLNINANVVNHTFRIPVKILRDAQDMLHEPTHSDLGLIMRLPNEFVTMFKRLEKFKKVPSSESVTIRASRRNGGFLGFILEESGKFKVTISWNDKLEVHKPTTTENDSLRETLRNGPSQLGENEEDITSDIDEIEVNVKLKDWQLASKIVGRCRTVILYIGERECSLHCLLDDTDDVEIVYFITGSRITH